MPKVEKPLTWGLVVSEDEVFSEKTGRWMEVLEARTNAGQTTLRFKGGGQAVPKFTRPASTPCRVRRSETGRVVDMFHVVFSGPS
jgi:hypothetical protein